MYILWFLFFTVDETQNYTDTLLPIINMTIDKIKKTTNRILAISMAEPAIDVNPNTAATIAIIKNVAAHCNIEPPPSYLLIKLTASFILFVPTSLFSERFTASINA